MTDDNRAGLAAVLASFVLIGIAAGQAYALGLLLGDGPSGDWTAFGATFGIIAAIALNAWLWFRLAYWFDRLLGGTGR